MENKTDRLLRVLLEYAFVFFVFVDCNSLYSSIFENSKAEVRSIIYYCLCSFACLLLLYYTVLARKKRIPLKGLLIGLLILYLCLTVLYFGNVRVLQSPATEKNFIRYAVVFLPIMTTLFFLMRKTGQTFDLFYRYADLVCVFAVINLLIYSVLTLFPEDILSDKVWSTWSDLGRIRELRNFFDICMISLGGFRNVLGFQIFRNQGLFTEPLMFSIPLLTALAIEMFLKTRNRWSIAKWILLSAVIFTTQATLGMMLALLAWGLVVFRNSPSKFRKVIFPSMLLIMLAGFGVLLHQKLSITNSSSFTSFAYHLEDYRLGLKALLNKPVFGGGFQNEAYIRTFMSEERLTHNRGLSNSIAIMLGTSGMVGGLFYLFPYTLIIGQFWKKENRGVACWGVCMLALYCVVIFYTRFFCYLIYAFGFSLVDLNQTERGHVHYSLLTELNMKSIQQNKEKLFPPGQTLLICATVWLILLLARKPLFSFLYLFFMRYQLMLGQSLWKFTGLCFMLLFAALFVRSNWQNCRHKVSIVIILAVYHVLFLFVYPRMYSWINTGLQIQGKANDFLESLIIFLVYLLPYGIFGLLKVAIRISSTHKRFRIVAAFVVIVTIFGVGFYCYITGRLVDQQQVLELNALIPVLETVTENAQGPVFANEFSAAYHQENPKISYTAAKDRGFAAYPCVSVIFAHSSDERELFANGFEMTELSEELLLYTNDKAVIQRLQEKGYAFYRYYPFESSLNLSRARKSNGLVKPDGGGLLVEGAEHSLSSGTRYFIEAGEYTVTYQLHMDLSQAEPGDVVCHPSITYNNGDDIAVYRDVNADQFDEQGNLILDIPVKMGLWENVQFLLLGEKEYVIQVKKIAWRQTPAMITVRQTNGRDQAVREDYYQLNGEPYINADGVSAFERTYNRVGQVIAVRYYDENNQPVMTRAKYSEVHYVYNSKGLKEEESYYGVDGKPCLQANGSAGARYTYNSSWNLTEIQYFGLKREPVICSGGYARRYRIFNEKGQLIREEYYDTEDRRSLLSAGYAACEFDYDENGNVAVIRYFGVQDEPILISDGYAEIHRFFNAQKQNIREEYYGTDGLPIILGKGFAVQEIGYDNNGNAAVYRYYGMDGNKVVINEGYAELHRKYNEKKQIIRDEYYGTDGKRQSLAGGYSAVGYTYDEAGNTIVYSYLDDENQPVITSAGYAEMHREYDERHQVIHEKYYGIEGKLISLFEGYSMVEYDYDDVGNMRTVQYQDATGSMMLTRSGYAEIHRVYNERKQVVREEYCGTDGKLLLRSSGYAAWEREVNELGTVIWQKYYGVSGEPVMIKEGYHELRREIDEEGKILSERYFDVEGKLISKTSGYAVLMRSYTQTGDIKEDVFLDSEGKPATVGAGYSVIRYEYDENHQLMLTYYLDSDGNPVQAGSAYLHDYLRNLISRRKASEQLTILISMKENTANALTATLYQDIKELGIQTDLRKRYRNSFYAIIDSDQVIEEISYESALTAEGTFLDGTPYVVTSAGYQVGNFSSIQIGGEEYSKNVRGMNFVLYDSSLNEIVDAVAFDICVQEMTVTR